MKTALSALALWLGVIWAGASTPAAAAVHASGHASGKANVAAPASETVVQVADWVVASGDNRGLPFVIIDKVAAEVFVFAADGQPRGAAPALIGSARGDESTPGVGDRELSSIPPEERTTPAGRFLAGFGPAWGGKTVLWVDYAAAISLHQVINTNRKERRLQRLWSPTPQDNRITYGCINVSAAFYRDVVRPAFTGTNGVVYILPETAPLTEVLPSFRAQSAAASAPPDRLGAGRAPDLGVTSDSAVTSALAEPGVTATAQALPSAAGQ